MIYIQVVSNLGVQIAFPNKLNYAKRESMRNKVKQINELKAIRKLTIIDQY